MFSRWKAEGSELTPRHWGRAGGEEGSRRCEQAGAGGNSWGLVIGPALEMTGEQEVLWVLQARRSAQRARWVITQACDFSGLFQ